MDGMERQAEVARLIAGYAAQLKITQTGPNDYAITARDVNTGLRCGVRADGNDGIIFAGTLTKSVVMHLPEDAFILSNCCNPDGSPILVRQVGKVAERAELWSQLRALRQNGRRFYVFAHKDGLDAHLARLEEMRARYEVGHP